MDYVHVYGSLHVLFLLLMLQGIINGSQRQSCSCSGYGGCNFTNKCVPENNCTKENIALGKPANMSSVFDSDISACLAVNGNTSTSFYISSDGKSNCVKSSSTENYPSWTVDLGQNYTIRNITLYTERSYPRVTDYLQITVDGNMCFQFEFGYEGHEQENIMCTKPVNGRTVKFYSPRNYYIFFCEVQVWVCIAGLYGDACDQVCHCKDNDTCDNHFGTCTSGCASGFYGSSCKHMCGDCTNGNICNTTTGMCPGGCNPGWTPPYCNETCEDGYYGYNCSSSCGNCLGGVCNKINGICPTGCEAGWQNNTCNQALLFQCDDGYYGLSCNRTCGKCANFSVCNKTTGICPNGCDSGWTTHYSCKTGTYGVNCSENCGNCLNGAPCDNVNGMCPSCEPGLYPPLCQQACGNGTYGQNCSGLCGNCTNGEPCDKVNGTCPSCYPGFKPSLCQQGCDSGTYGQNCLELCGNCMNGEPCNKVNGSCHSCKPGLKMPLCQQECDGGFYGQNCQSECGEGCYGSTCHTTSGLCDCVSGWQSHFCNQIAETKEQSGITVGPLVGAIIGGFVSLGFIISATIVILRRRKSRSSDSTNTTNTVFQPPSNTSFSFKSTTPSEAANEYDEIEHHYDSLHPVDDSENHNYAPPAFEERIFKSTQQNHVYVNAITKDRTD